MRGHFESTERQALSPTTSQLQTNEGDTERWLVRGEQGIKITTFKSLCGHYLPGSLPQGHSRKKDKKQNTLKKRGNKMWVNELFYCAFLKMY